MTLPHMENEQKIEFPYPVVILWNINELKYEQEKLEHVPIEVLWRKLDDAPRKLEPLPAQVFWRLDDTPRKLEPLPAINNSYIEQQKNSSRV